MSSLPRRRVGSSDVEVSALSVGSWHTYDRMDFADAVAMIRTAVAAGVNLFDVGVYGFPGMPPVFTDVIWSAIMRASGIPREEYLVSAKLWLEGFGDEGFRPQLENAFLRGGFDVADLVILGDIRRDDIALEDLVEDLAALTKAGLIRAWGVNNWSATNIRRLQEIAAERGVAGPQIAQLKYSIGRRSIPDGEPFAALFAEGFSMQASDVLEGGLLAGSTTGREIGRDPGGVQGKIRENAAAVAEVAAKLGTSAARLAVAFTLTHPANVTTLFGATKQSQLADNLAAVDLVEQVGAEELRALVEPFWVDRGVVDPEGP
ncbi:aldo/keto reductase [Actinokineospora globicatena]|uniref:aldo/keto reductase n=1 Tax=Actinokineospora globicatena TaxID=103729 RepID=UPI0020A5CA60|nr:aldo/keto reductase [Actinokineospora globicatena]MCP2305989.1 putative oxidoreductase [Actinokineospora globicatena]GLW80140.1 potassium channel subunit [Actinokineospora globicatena]GLW86969.1 potassium channel subunit [Actinokineospora globicatena]